MLLHSVLIVVGCFKTYRVMKWKRKLLSKTNNADSSNNPISVPFHLCHRDESLRTFIPNDSSHTRPIIEPYVVTPQVVQPDICRPLQLLNSISESPVEGIQDSASGCLNRKSPPSSSRELFSRYSELCGRSVLANCSLDITPAVEHPDFNVFEKYSDLCRTNAVAGTSKPSVHVVRDTHDSASGCLKRKSPPSSSRDAFSRYSELCGRNVLAKCSLDITPAVEHPDFNVFEKYSDLCRTNAVTGTSNPSVHVVRDTTVVNSQHSLSEPLRLNITERDALLDDITHLNTPIGGVFRLNDGACSSGQSEGFFLSLLSTLFSPFGCIIDNVSKKRQWNAPVVESSSKKPRYTAPRATDRRIANVTRDDGEGCSSGQGRGMPYGYVDLRDCNQQCQHCGAAFWFGKRLKGHSNYRKPKYHLCCGGGGIQMQPNEDPPEYFKNLLQNKHFMENIRAYNQMLAMTSFEAKIDESINHGRGPYVFKVSGQVYHWIGSLCHPPGESLRFLKLYIYDTDHEVENRMRHFGSIDDNDLDPDIVEGLIHFMDAHNQLVQLFRTARDKCREIHIPEFKIRLYNAEGARRYELPASNVLGAVVFDSGVSGSTDFDIIIQEKAGPPKRISKLHKAADGSRQEQKLMMLAYYSYQLHHRVKDYNLMFRTGRLFQQYVVGVYCTIEQSRGERDGYEVGGRIILLMSFTGGPQYMYAHYLDALAICRKLGNPQFFITFTCNVNWPEIKRYMDDYLYLTPSDRADGVCRVFEQKIQALVAFLKTENFFGQVTGVLYTVEFQKRGLPHCHTLLWVHSKNKIKEAQDVDRFISAELPDLKIDPQGYRVVSDLMMHGPCGAAKMSAPCMKRDKCNKTFPKKYDVVVFAYLYNIKINTS
nr:DNA helicase [Tanacetum cinerariifolium]